jgi:TonB family protein
VIAQRAQAFTNASGAAIAIGEGNADEIVCRARSGSSAPDVGTALRVEGSFTGICIQSGKELRCDDAETDTRVDTSAIRALGIRSMVVTPIRDEGKVTGVLAVFAPTPHAFTITHVAVLKTMADQISALLQKERLTKDEPPLPAPVPVALPKPVKPAVPAVPLPPPVVIKPVAPPSPPQPPIAVKPPRPAVPSTPRVEASPLALAADIAVPAPFSRKEERRDHRIEPAIPPKMSFGTFDAVTGEAPRSSSNKFIAIGAIATVVVGVGAWLFFGTHKTNSPAPAPAQQAQNSAPAQPVATPAASNPVPALPVAAAPAPASVTPPASARPEVTERTTERTTERVTERATNTNRRPEPARSEPARRKEPQEAPPPTPTPATVSLGTGASRIAPQPAAEQPADVSANLALGAGSQQTGLSNIVRPMNNAAPSMVAQSDLVNSKPIRTISAVYPELAKSRRISGAVVIRVMVGKDGKVKNPTFVSGPLIFRDAAFDAVKQWLFKPAQLNGQAIEQETEIRMNFNPTN